jgi:phosphatidylserine decarboxylase
MAKEGIYFLLPLVAATAGALWAGWTWAAFVSAGLGLFVAFFFRDPPRVIPSDPGIIVAPADGRVVRIESEGHDTRVSIFLSIFNVHINRSPIAGTVKSVRYRKGRFRAAFNHIASVENEQNTLTFDGEGLRLDCSQIAGLVARRIVCRAQPGDTLARGERFGLIRFGSRTDLLLPPNVEVLVNVGDKVHGGSSVIGRIMAEEQRQTA